MTSTGKPVAPFDKPLCAAARVNEPVSRKIFIHCNFLIDNQRHSGYSSASTTDIGPFGKDLGSSHVRRHRKYCDHACRQPGSDGARQRTGCWRIGPLRQPDASFKKGLGEIRGLFLSGCSREVRHLLWEQGISGSIPFIQTNLFRHRE